MLNIINYINRETLLNKFNKLKESVENTITVDGDGKSFLSNDGTYKTIDTTGTGDVTTEQLEAAIAPLATKQEVTDGLATKVETSAFETYKDDVTNELDTKADKSQIITKTDGDGTSFLANDGSYKVITTQGSVDLSPYATIVAMNTALDLKADKDQIPDVSNLATKTELQDGLETKADAADLVDINDAITTIQSSLDSKANKDEIPDVTSLATKTEVQEALELKADKTDIPDISNLATTDELQAVSDTLDATITDVQTNYAKKSEIPDVPDTTQFALKTDIITKTDGGGILFLADDGTYKAVSSDQDPPDLSGFASKTYVDNAVGALETTANETFATKAELPDVTKLATKEELENGLLGKVDTDSLTATNENLNQLEAVVTGHTASIARLSTDKAD